MGALSIVDVWQALGGGEIRQGRGRAFWRDGGGFNVAIDSGRGIWHDFVTNEGGGMVRLVQAARRCTKGEAFRWLADLAGIALTPDSPARRARYAEARRDAEALAKLACWWLAGQLSELEELKRLNNGDEGPLNEAALTAASSELWRLEQIEAAAVVPEWTAARASDPDRTGELEQVGQVWERFRHAVIGRVVQQLAELRVSESEVLRDPR
ncbi:MAG TPA: hypothetical protein VGK29_01880 [Paludibaculum sp.]|jgi:hypothetical protein